MATLDVIPNQSALEAIKRLSDVHESGDYQNDCSIGRQLADELVDEIHRGRAIPAMLGHVVRDLVEHGTFGAVQVGFFQRIAEWTM